MMEIRRARAVCASISAIFGICAVVTPAARADAVSDSGDADRRWVPSASFLFMGNVDQRTADMSSDAPGSVGGPPLDQNGQSIGIFWALGGTLDLATPVLLDAPTRPRLFAHVDLAYSYDVEDPVATRGDPGGEPFLPFGSTTPIALENIGATVRAEGKPLTFTAGIGTVHSFEWLERGFRFRPTLEWMYHRDTVRTAFGTGEQGPGANCTTCRVLFIESQTEKGFHSLGPGVELEADVGRLGDFLVGFYGAFRAYYLVGDRKANLRASGSWELLDGSPAPRPDSTFVTEYEREPWHYRFGAGFRVLWSPED